MEKKEYDESGALIAEYDRVHVEDAPAVDVEEMARRGMSVKLWRIVRIIARGLRHVALPEEMPERIGIVIDYPQTTVRHEFVPRNDENE